MEKILAKDLLPLLRTHGRTLWREPEQTLYFNWTASGVELLFHGRTLLAELAAMPGAEQELDPMTGRTGQRETWPWMAVVLDGQEAPARKMEIDRPRSVQLLFHSDEPQTHRVRLVKRTENGKGFLGLTALVLDGEILPLPEEPAKKRIEFIGDSITCGFGNDTRDKDRLFYPQDEDGWMSHGPITARLLGMEASVVSSSGIALTLFPGWFHSYGMDDLYPYADRFLEDRLGLKTYTSWDHRRERTDYVVLDLGTNDANAIDMMGTEAGMALHARVYGAFLEMLRRVHGEQTWIICALGSMDYSLYPQIQAAVESYRARTGDRRVSCFRYPKMYFQDPVGACGHPHIVTHEKMARAMAAYISGLERSGRDPAGEAPRPSERSVL